MSSICRCIFRRENPVEDAIFRAQGSALPIPAKILDSFPEDGVHLKDHLAEIERNLIIKALEESNGNVSKSARLLNLQRTTLIEKLINIIWPDACR